MRGLAFGIILVLLPVGCSGAVRDDDRNSANLVGDAGDESDGTATPDATVPFEGPCNPAGSWKLTYEVTTSDCGLAGLASVIVIAPEATPPISIPNDLGVDLYDEVAVSIEDDGCTVRAQWGYEYELGGEGSGGEVDGEQNRLELSFTSPNTAEGSLFDMTYWACGYQKTIEFLAHAQRQ